MRAGVLVLMLVACASKAPAPLAPTPVVAPKPVATEPPDVVRWGELQRELAGKLRSAPACGGVAEALRGFVGAHPEQRRTFEAVAAWESATPRHKVDSFYSKYRADLDVRIDAGIRCKDDKLAREAFDRFFEAAGLAR